MTEPSEYASRVLAYIKKHLDQHGELPGFATVATRLRGTVPNTRRAYRELAELGIIQWQDRVAKSVVFTDGTPTPAPEPKPEETAPWAKLL